MNSTGRKLLAEFVGTFLLVFLAVGAAVFGIGAKVGTDGAGPGNGVVGVALAFGLVLLAMAYAFGPVSGAHVNPAVTLAMLIGRRMPTNEAVGYWIAQFLGGILGGFALWLFVNAFGVTDYTGGLGTNSYDNGHISMAGAFVLEVLLTAAFVADPALGVMTGIAIITHEIPQEVGDFAIMLESGFSRLKTFALNAVSDRKSTRLNSSHSQQSRMPSSA